VRYRWTFAGATPMLASTGRALGVDVRPALATTASRPAIARGATTTLSVRVRPAHNGARVTLQRYVRGVGWVKVATVVLTKVNATTSHGSVRVRIARAGRWSYRFVMPADAHHVKGTSNAVVVRVS
jgi:hypothetical protein